MGKVMVCGEPGLWRRQTFLVACSGCQEPTVGRILAELIEELGIEGETIGIAGVGCYSALAGTIDIDWGSSLHGRAPDVATGIKRSLRGKPVVFTIQGDGDCASIGGGGLLAAATRAEKITIIMLNNANYGTTGGQAAPTTLLGQVTTTTPGGRSGDREGYPIHVAEMLATFKGVAYSARGALTSPAHYRQTKKYIKTALEKQIARKGLTFVEVLVACPVNWGMTPLESLKWIEEELMKSRER